MGNSYSLLTDKLYWSSHSFIRQIYILKSYIRHQQCKWAANMHEPWMFSVSWEFTILLDKPFTYIWIKPMKYRLCS